MARKDGEGVKASSTLRSMRFMQRGRTNKRPEEEEYDGDYASSDVLAPVDGPEWRLPAAKVSKRLVGI